MMKKILTIAFVFILMNCTKNKNPHILISTQLGDIEAELFAGKATVTATNFLRYVDSGKYNKGIASFYRVVRPDNQPGKKILIEVIQGGFHEDLIIEKYQFTPIRPGTNQGQPHRSFLSVLGISRNWIMEANEIRTDRDLLRSARLLKE